MSCSVLNIFSPSNKLTSNKAHPILNSDGKADKNHIITFRAEDFESATTNVCLTRGGMILVALLRGGDYDDKVL